MGVGRLGSCPAQSSFWFAWWSDTKKKDQLPTVQVFLNVALATFSSEDNSGSVSWAEFWNTIQGLERETLVASASGGEVLLMDCAHFGRF